MTFTSTGRSAAAAARSPLPSVAGTLLGVWAHPDDEAFLSAGLMASVRSSGGRVAVATATRGERGTADPDTWPPERLGRLREDELNASLAAVGVTDHRFLGHADGELSRVPVGEGAAQVEALIEEVRPHTIVTFGPDGMTGHPDHRAVADWVFRAWIRTGRRSSLWQATLTTAFHHTWGALNEQVGVWLDGALPPVTPDAGLAALVRCDGELLDRKYEALRAHASQTDGLVATVGEARFRRWWAEEAFVAADGRGVAATGPRRVACRAAR